MWRKESLWAAFNFKAKAAISGLCFTYEWSDTVSDFETWTMWLAKIAMAVLEVQHYETYYFLGDLCGW